MYKGTITGITNFGIFVQISSYGVEGLIRYIDMDDDYYVLSEADYHVYGKKTKKKYTMGDGVYVKVKRANVAKEFLDLLFENE